MVHRSAILAAVATLIDLKQQCTCLDAFNMFVLRVVAMLVHARALWSPRALRALYPLSCFKCRLKLCNNRVRRSKRINESLQYRKRQIYHNLRVRRVSEAIYAPK